jgi:prephenate dehydratase
LQRKYSHLKLVSGEGDAIDPAKVAEMLSEGKLEKNIAALGSKGLAEIYGLKIAANNLQDSGSNFTTFVWVQRPKQS